MSSRRPDTESITPHSPLLDETWIGAAMAYVREADSMVDRRAKVVNERREKAKSRGRGGKGDGKGKDKDKDE